MGAEAILLTTWKSENMHLFKKPQHLLQGLVDEPNVDNWTHVAAEGAFTSQFRKYKFLYQMAVLQN